MPHDQLFWRFHEKGTLIIRKGADKLIRQGSGVGNRFDLANDMAESDDVAAQNRPVRPSCQGRRTHGQRTCCRPHPGLGSWAEEVIGPAELSSRPRYASLKNRPKVD